jgi:hypothetical protein
MDRRQQAIATAPGSRTTLEARPAAGAGALLAAVVALLLTAPPALAAAAESQPGAAAFKLAVEVVVEGGPTVASEVFFLGRHAVELDEGGQSADAIFDLDAMSWLEVEAGVTVELADAVSWAATTRKRAEADLAEMPAGHQQQFTARFLTPGFAIRDKEGGLLLNNEFMSFDIKGAPAATPEQTQRFLAYDRLSAYRKAMVLGQMPPFPQLAVNDAMAARSLLPREIKMLMAAGTESGSARILLRVVELTGEELALIRRLLPA